MLESQGELLVKKQANKISNCKHEKCFILNLLPLLLLRLLVLVGAAAATTTFIATATTVAEQALLLLLLLLLLIIIIIIIILLPQNAQCRRHLIAVLTRRTPTLCL